jgi:hypothetical protein
MQEEGVGEMTATSGDRAGSKIKQSRLEGLPPSSSSVVFSSQKSQFADYTTWKGIETKTGIEQGNAISFLVKELLDNALDYLESTQQQYEHHHYQQPRIDVILEVQQMYMRITVSNSNTPHTHGQGLHDRYKPVFSKQILESIFDFDRYHSSKRNQFRITKGALGDALKEVLCIPQLLAYDNGWSDWNYTLYVISHQKLFQIQLIIDKINQVIRSNVEEADFGFDSNAKLKTEVAQMQMQCHHLPSPNCTQIVLTIPIINRTDHYRELYQYIYDYAIFASHVKLTFEDKHSRFFKEFPQLQNINPKWKNQTSIYYYDKKHFNEFILGLDNNDSIVYDVLYSTFREGSNMPKSQINQITVGQLKHSNIQIDRLFEELRDSMKNAPSVLSLPFDITKKVRAKALQERVSCSYGSFKEMKFRSTTGFYSDGAGTQIPFYFEIAIFHEASLLKTLNRNLVFKQAINGSALPDNGGTPFSVCEFKWNTKDSKYTYISHSIYDIFARFGYAYSKPKKPYSLIIANLICPKIDYQSYGKSRIDFSPFASAVAETTVLACMGGGRSSDGKPSKRQVLFEVLQDRKYTWNSLDAVQKQKRWWTQSDVFYATRKLLIETYHYSNEEIDRNYITGLIKEVCEDDLGVKREDIGILAADRAQFYFDGKWMDVGLKEIEQLSMYGIALLIIEKEGVAEQLRLFADEKRIALLNTRGFLTEYAEILSRKSEEEGCKVAILSDFDASGLVLAGKAPNAYRIGIDFETLRDLGLDIKDVEEEYKPGSHLDPLSKYNGKMYKVYPADWIDYIATKRVEINSVTEALKDNEKFWNWILEKLRTKFTDWDYTRAVDTPDYVKPRALESLNETVEKIGTAKLKERHEQLRDKISDIGPGFLFDRTDQVLQEQRLKTGKGDDMMTIAKYEEAIVDQSRRIIESDETLRPFLEEIEDLDNQLQCHSPKERAAEK